MSGRYYRASQNWGNQLWNYIHSITIIDFDDCNVNKKFGLEIYECLKTLKLPCKHCQKELDEEINNIDIDKLTESMYLFKWSYNFHNKINAKLNKSILIYEDAIKIHTNKI